MRRITIIGTALAVLVVAGSAFAATALNSYSAKLSFSPSKAGSAKSPSPLGLQQNLGAASTTPGNRAAGLTDIKTTIYGVVSNAKYFPTCSAAKIVANQLKWDKACPSKSLVASGPVLARLGPSNTLAGAGTDCNLLLNVYNGGSGKLVFFFELAPIAPAKYKCGGIQTGAGAPYIGTSRQSGKNLVQDVPLPPDVSTKAGNLSGVYGSLTLEQLAWRKLTTKVHGKTVGFLQSMGCKGGKRPWSEKFTAVNAGTTLPAVTVSGSSKS
jgi:hypothetical protein